MCRFGDIPNFMGLELAMPVMFLVMSNGGFCLIVFGIYIDGDAPDGDDGCRGEA